jgi:hypothetical protein
MRVAPQTPRRGATNLAFSGGCSRVEAAPVQNLPVGKLRQLHHMEILVGRGRRASAAAPGAAVMRLNLVQVREQTRRRWSVHVGT